MINSKDQKRALIELWDLVLRHRWRFIVPAFVVAAVVLLGSLGLPRKYRASAQFERRNDLVLTEMASRGATRSFQDPRSSITEEISGRSAVDTLLTTLGPKLKTQGLVAGEADLHNLRDDLLHRVIVQWDIATAERDRIRVEYIGLDPQVSSLVVNGLIDGYISRSRAELDSKLSETAAFFRTEVNQHRTAIEALENNLLEFEIEHAAMLPDTPNNLQHQLVSIRESLSDVMSQRDAEALRIQALRQALTDAPRTIPTIVTARNPELAHLEQRLRDLRQQLHQYTAVLKMTPAHPDVQTAQSQIAELEARIASTDTEVVTQRQTVSNPRRADIELQLAAAESEYQAYSNQVRALQQQITDMASHGAGMFEVRGEHRKLHRELSEKQRQMAFWEDNLRRVEMALAAESGNRGVQFEWIQQAQASARPVSPQLAQVIAAAILLGGAAGALGVFLAHRHDETFIGGDDLARAVGLPLFGTVSEIISNHQRRMRRVQRAVLYPTAGIAMTSVLVGAAAVLYLDLEDPAAMNDLKERARSLIAQQPMPSPPSADVASASTDGLWTQEKSEDGRDRDVPWNRSPQLSAALPE